MQSLIPYQAAPSLAKALNSTYAGSFDAVGRLFDADVTDPVGWVQAAIERLADGPPKVRAVGVGPRALDSEFRRRIDFDGTVRFDVRRGAVQRLLDRNATVVLNRCERVDDGLGHLATELRQLRLGDVAANAYLSTQESRTFGWHADTHDVAVLQLAGRKTWRISTARDQPTAADLTPEATIELGPGDALRVRRSTWHAVETSAGPSLHITLALFPLSFDYLVTTAAQHIDAANEHPDLAVMQPDQRLRYLAKSVAQLATLLGSDPLAPQESEQDDVDALAGDDPV